MEKTNIRRLIGVLMPFMIMVILQRLGLVLVGMAGISERIGSTLAFMIASAAGIFFFRMSCGVQALRPGTVPEADAQDGEESHIARFPAKDSLFGQILYLLIGIGILIVTMYAVSAVIREETAAVFTPGMLFAEFVSLVLIHPFLEEYLFRWLYYRELRPMQPIFAGLTQAVMFAIVHGSVGGMIYALFAGVVLVVITERSGTLAVPVAVHMLVNLRSLVYMVWLADAETLRLMLDFGFVAVGFAAVLVRLVRRGLREVWNSAESEEPDEQ